MQVYFDKPNLVSFIKSAVQGRKFAECEETILKHCQVFMTFKKDDLLQDNEENEVIKDWMKRCADGFDTDAWVWGNLFPVRPISSTTPNRFNKNQHSAVYLISDPQLKLLQDKNQYIVPDLGNELKELSQLWFDDRQYNKNIFDELTSWPKLIPYQSPCSDIIIVDQFFTNDKDKMKHNLEVIIPQLCYRSPSSHIKIVIFSEKTEGRTNPQWNAIRSKIQVLVQQKTHKKPSVTIVIGSKQRFEEHDRTIFTNYKLYNSGDSFNYFDGQGNKTTRGRYFWVISQVSRENNKIANKFLNDMQKVYEAVKATHPENIFKDAGDSSNYLSL